MTPEQKLTEAFVRSLSRRLAKGRFHLQRIETSTGTGIPDLYFRHQKFSCWLETKTLEYSVSKEQCAWAHMEKLAGGTTWVVTRDKDGEFLVLPFDTSMSQYKTLGQYLRGDVRGLQLLGDWLDEHC